MADNAELNPDQAEAFRQAEEMKRLVETTGDMAGLSPVDRLEKTRPEFEHLVEELKPGIEDHRWSAILADDVSGRIPGLIVHDVIKRYGGLINTTYPDLYFVAGGRDSIVKAEDIDDYDSVQDERVNNFHDYLAKIKSQLGERVLLVTDVVITERSLFDLADGLHQAGIPFDVAILHEDSAVHGGEEEDEALVGVNWFGGGSENWSKTPIFAPEALKPRLRGAIGTEKYGNSPVSESIRQHELRQGSEGDSIPANPDIAELRGAIRAMSDEIYHRTFK